MSSFLGLNPSVAQSKSAALKAQLPTLDHLISELNQTYSAALHPHNYGIDSGEMTVSPWSVNSVMAARNELSAARVVIAEMAERIGLEIAAQARTSGNLVGIAGGALGRVPFTHLPPPAGHGKVEPAPDFFGAIIGGIKTLREWRSYVSGPLAVLQLSSAFGLLLKSPYMWQMALHPTTFLSPAWYNIGRDLLSSYATNKNTNIFVQTTWKWANVLKPDWVVSKAGTSLLNTLPESTKWLPKALQLVEGSAAWLKTTGMVVGKVAGVLGAGFGAVTLVTGIVGLADGDPTSEDAWAVADGAVGVICGIGSLVPPPVGIVFAAVGGAYALGRFLFSPLEDGKTPLEHMGSFFTDVGTNVGNFGADVLHNYGLGVTATVDAVSDGVKTATKVVSHTVEAVGETVSKLADTAGKVFDDLWPF